MSVDPPDPLQYRDHRRYALLGQEGRGGVGRVYRAHDNELCRDVALKEPLKPGDITEARFLREAMITARLEHPGIMPLHDAGRWWDGTPFYSMKLMVGSTLAELLNAAETADQRITYLPHLIVVADATAYAHDKNVIHRDLKPSNIMVGERGECMVGDWGLAKDLSNTDEEDVEGEPEDAQSPSRSPASHGLTRAGQVLGTPAYMAPEQAAGEKVDKRADVYSLGAMLFELCTGGPPETEAPIDDLRRALRGVSEDLAAIALKALAKSPDDRYPDAGAFAADLKAFDTGARIAARNYSLAAILGHWIRHHKKLALAVAIPSVIAVVIGFLSLRAVVLHGQREAAAKREADKARVVAEKERDLAVRSQAAMLLEKDPTKARDLLASRPMRGPDEALLMARVLGTPTADHVITFAPYNTWDAVPNKELESLAISATDKTLRIIDLATGRMKIVDRKLLTPTLLFQEDRGFSYARHGQSGRELVRAGQPTNPIPLLSSWELPNNAAVSRDGLYMLGASGDVALLSASGKYRHVVRGVRGIVAYKDGILACTKDDLLRIASGSAARIGSCRHSGGWRDFGTNGLDYVVQASPTTVVMERGGVRSTLSIHEPNQFVAGAGGLVVGADVTAKRSWYVPPGMNEKAEGPPSESTPTALGADGGLAAWGYMDGTARVRDTRTGATWTFVGHTTSIYWVFVSERLRRLVTVGGPEVRVWPIPLFSLRPIGKLPRGALNAASSPDGRWTVFDDTSGTVALVDHREPASGLQVLHRHTDMAYGVTWRGNDACSSGRDGRVICTDVVERSTKVIAKHPQPIRFVHSAGEVLAYTVEDGGVWAHAAGSPTPKLLYSHDFEPYRVAVSTTGDIASGADDGSLMVYEDATHSVHSARIPHQARIYQLHWSGDELRTSSFDGTIRTWSKELVSKEVHSADRPIRDLELIRSGWVANVGAKRIWFHSDGTDLQLETGPDVADLAVSVHGRFIGAVVSRDLIVYDTHAKAVAAVRVGDATPICAHFADDKTVFLCGSSGELLSAAVNTLPFVSLHKGGSVP